MSEEKDEVQELLDSARKLGEDLNRLWTDSIADASSSWKAIADEETEYGTSQAIADMAKAFARSVKGWRIVTASLLSFAEASEDT